jgi:DNA-directed RNA polymerase subunit M/transcription elongation factor TFIIS
MQNEMLDAARDWAHLPLHFDFKQRLVICRSCGYALAHSQVASHLREKHQISPEQHKGLTLYIERYSFQEPGNTAPRDDGCREHPALRTYGGFACSQCHCRTVTEQQLRAAVQIGKGQRLARCRQLSHYY